MNRPNDKRRRQRGGRYGRSRVTRVANSQANDNVPVPQGLVFYCKTCERILDFHPETFNFKLPIEGCPRAAAASASPVGGGAGGNGAAVGGGTVKPGETGAAVVPLAAGKGVGLRGGLRGGRPRKEKPERQCEIVYGTERSIKHYFKVPDSRLDAKRREEEERAAKADKL